MNKKKDLAMVIVMTAWVPLGILAFYLSPAEMWLKVAIAAGVSFIAFLIWCMKDN